MKSNQSSFYYRPDIDGLRAVAVVAVILFHIHADMLIGGFLGVDIFFVISGYLITLLLLKDISTTQQLNLVHFYQRRIKRLFPALIFIVASTLLAGFFIMAPDDYSDLVQAAVASLFSAANIYVHFFVDTGYFAADSSELPFLHLWSLGVEEQFYILWPFLIFILVKWVKAIHLKWLCMLCLTLLSLTLAQVMLTEHFSFTYYMLPTRAWELSIGGLLALGIFHGLKLSKRYAMLSSLLGFLLIISSLFWISETHSIPGIGAVPAVIGTALLIAGGSHTSTLTYQLLTLKPMIAIGKVSYSAYLWHWPILAFLKYSFVEITLSIGIMAFISTFLMASISYFFVEQPFRKNKTSALSTFTFYFFLPVAVISMLCVAIFFSIRWQTPHVYDWQAYQKTLDTKPAYWYDYNCQFSQFSENNFGEKRCTYPENTQANVLLVGDSNAAHYVGMLRVFSEHYNFSIKNITQSSCPFLLTQNPPLVSEVKQRYKPGCQTYLTFIPDNLDEYDIILIGGSWHYYEKHGGNNFKQALKETIDILLKKNKTIILLAKNPMFKNYNIDCEVRKVRITSLECNSTRFNTPDVDLPINVFLQELASNSNQVYYFDAKSEICSRGTCSPYLNGSPVYFDGGHYSILGSKKIGESMIQTGNPHLAPFSQIFKN